MRPAAGACGGRTSGGSGRSDRHPLVPLCAAPAAGSWLELEVDTTVPDAGAPEGSSSGGSATVHLSYLQGWAPRLGAARVACASGCTCAPQLLDTHRPDMRYTYWVSLVFQARLKACAAGRGRAQYTWLVAPNTPAPAPRLAGHGTPQVPRAVDGRGCAAPRAGAGGAPGCDQRDHGHPLLSGAACIESASLLIEC